MTLWGTHGKISADRQELRIFLRDEPNVALNLNKGWNTRYTTELTQSVEYYLRGEEYSEQIDHFIQRIKGGRTDTRSTFRSAWDTDLVAAMIIKDSDSSHINADCLINQKTPSTEKNGLLASIKSLLT